MSFVTLEDGSVIHSSSLPTVARATDGSLVRLGFNPEERLLTQAATAFDVKEKELNAFDVEDIFNDGNRLRGFLCRHGDHRYGALFIHTINEDPCHPPQIIFGTPKMKYPMDLVNRVFSWPKCSKVNVYEKYDGTNVLAYSYYHGGKEYVTYKTRLTPVLCGSKWGDFPTMWREMLKCYPQIPQAVLDTRLSLSFELFGSRNKHMILYDELLDVRMLFGVTTRTLHPKVVDVIDIPWGIPVPDCVSNSGDLTTFYDLIRVETEAKNQTTEFGISGSEGSIFYCHLVDGGVQQFKCKPETIEKIAWAASGLNKNSIMMACFNAFEIHDPVTVDVVKELLCEDYELLQVEEYHYMIGRVLDEVQDEIDTRNRIVATYKDLGVSLIEDKAGAMRAMSAHFEKRQMGYVYFVLSSHLA